MPYLSSSQSHLVRTLVAMVVIALFYSSIPFCRVQAAAGDLDLSFGSGGKVTTSFSANPGETRDVVIQPDGKIIAAGVAFDPITRGDFGLVRYNKNGSLDTTFGIGGNVTTDFLNIPSFGSVDAANAVALQADGKIVVAGLAGIGSFSFGLARYEADGSLDSGFGSGGRVITRFSKFDASANDVAIQPDGKIIAVGSTNTSFDDFPKPDFAIARYNTDGSLDSTFGVGGKVTTDFMGLGDTAAAVAIQTDRKIVVAGSSQVSLFAPELTQFSIARYNVDGTLDSSFGVGGKVRPFLLGGFDQANSVASLPNGKIIVAGVITNNHLPSESDFGMIRLNGDGSIDVSFGSGGIVTTDFSSEFDSANHIAIQSNGKIVLAGIVSKGRFEDLTDFAIARYNPDGSLDTSFGSGGRVTTDFFGFSNKANAVVIQQDGRILVAGRADGSGIGPPFEFALARYDGNSFDTCLQDDSSGALLQFSSSTGEYLFTNCSDLTQGGTGLISRRGNVLTLQQNGPDRRLFATVDVGVHRGSATMQLFSLGTTFAITDRNTLNDNCACAR
jgi:uncharacterized delta-60 repeat protein